MSDDLLTHRAHDAIDRIPGPEGHEDMHAYADAHPAIALEVALHGGTLSDMECMAALGDLLGFAPTWDLYVFIDDRLDEDVMKLLECRCEHCIEVLAALIEDYAKTQADELLGIADKGARRTPTVGSGFDNPLPSS